MTSVTIGVVHSDELMATFHASIERLRAYDAATDRYLDHDNSRIYARCGTDGLVASRNSVARAFLATDSEWLLWLDSDMGFEPDLLSRLVEVADASERPIVGALCFASREYAHDGLSGFRTRPRPTIYDWREVNGSRHFTAVELYPVNELVRCAGTGSAAILIHRSAFEYVSAMLEERGLEPDTWYDRARGTDGSWLGEDISFCARAGAAGIPIHVHTGIRTSHVKRQWVTEADHWRAYVVPPAVDETAVIVPVMRRPDSADPFMQSLRASTGMATVYAVADGDDQTTIDAWIAAGAQVAIMPPEGVSGTAGTFAEKVNYGYQYVRAIGGGIEPWIFVTGDDVIFRPAWLDHAQHVGNAFGASVVGTNDLGNPAVMAGHTATHLLIRRDYIDEIGASWDGPGIICHEGYRHWYVDNEIVEAAKQRAAWQAALGSHVEHLHPLWGKADDDEVYHLGQSHAEADGELFARRLKENAS